MSRERRKVNGAKASAQIVTLLRQKSVIGATAFGAFVVPRGDVNPRRGGSGIDERAQES